MGKCNYNKNAKQELTKYNYIFKNILFSFYEKNIEQQINFHRATVKVHCKNRSTLKRFHLQTVVAVTLASLSAIEISALLQEPPPTSCTLVTEGITSSPFVV